MSHTHSAKLSSTLILTIASCLLANAAFAKDYKVEVLIFENLQQQTALESYQYQEIDDISSNAALWSIEPSMLLDEVKSLQRSQDYQPLYYYSWGQESLPVSQSAAMNVLEETMRGWIKIYAGQLLFANLDLDYNGYRLSEKRRIKLNEKHFFDHPKFGILMQVSRLEAEEDDLLMTAGENPDTEPNLPLEESSKLGHVRNLLDDSDSEQSPQNAEFQQSD